VDYITFLVPPRCPPEVLTLVGPRRL